MEISGERWKLVEFSMGQAQIKVDEKGRMSLPVHAHNLLEDHSLVLSLSVYEKRVFLELLSTSDWKEKIEALNELPQSHPKTKALKRFMLSGSVQVSVDKQNRIIIPQNQRDALGLQREAIVINMDNKFELWSSERWEETFGSLVENMEDLESWAFDLEGDQQKEENNGLKSAA